MGLPIISLFCGCGGLDLGFTQSNFEVVLALDVDPIAVDTYNFNRSKQIAKVADLAQVDGHDIIKILGDLPFEDRPRGVIGGTPCQSFSHSNVHLKSDDIRRTLPYRYASILKTLHNHYDLDFFVFENVQGITFERHRREFAFFRQEFENAGFLLYESLLDAVDFGVPQKRPRVFVVGLNKDRYAATPFLFPTPIQYPIRSVSDAIYGLPEPRFFERGLRPEDIPYHPNHWTMNPRSQKFQNDYLKEGQQNGRSFRVLSWDKPSWAVAYGNREIHIHPSGKRRLTIYEAMILQSFPKTYQLLGTLTDQVRQVSDAVPPLLGKAIANAISLFLSENTTIQHSMYS